MWLEQTSAIETEADVGTRRHDRSGQIEDARLTIDGDIPSKAQTAERGQRTDGSIVGRHGQEEAEEGRDEERQVKSPLAPDDIDEDSPGESANAKPGIEAGGDVSLWRTTNEPDVSSEHGEWKDYRIVVVPCPTHLSRDGYAKLNRDGR